MSNVLQRDRPRNKHEPSGFVEFSAVLSGLHLLRSRNKPHEGSVSLNCINQEASSGPKSSKESLMYNASRE